MPPPPLPLPVALLARRAREAKSEKERHDCAFHAFDVSIRLAVILQGNERIPRGATPSLGDWVQAWKLTDRALEQPALLACHALCTEVVGQRKEPRAIQASAFFGTLVAYRNALAHGSVRESAFYTSAAEVLLEALLEAWSLDLFAVNGVQILYVESSDHTPDGALRGRVFDLGSEIPGLLAYPDSPLPTGTLPKRVYQRQGAEWTTLHPWLLFDPDQKQAFCYYDAKGGGGLPRLRPLGATAGSGSRAAFSWSGRGTQGPARHGTAPRRAKR